MVVPSFWRMMKTLTRKKGCSAAPQKPYHEITSAARLANFHRKLQTTLGKKKVSSGEVMTPIFDWYLDVLLVLRINGCKWIIYIHPYKVACLCPF